MCIRDSDSDLDQLDDLQSGLKARVIIDGWDKLIASPESKQLFDLRSDLDDKRDLSSEREEKVVELSQLIEDWVSRD